MRSPQLEWAKACFGGSDDEQWNNPRYSYIDLLCQGS